MSVRKSKANGKRRAKHFRGMIAHRVLRVTNGDVFRIRGKLYFLAWSHFRLLDFGARQFIVIPLFLANLLGLQHGVSIREQH